MTDTKITSTGAVVGPAVFWRPIDAETPRGAKLQLINRRDGVAHYGRFFGNDSHWTHWAPLPRFEEMT